MVLNLISVRYIVITVATINFGVLTAPAVQLQQLLWLRTENTILTQVN